MTNDMQEILVFPKKYVHGLDGFVPWTDAIKIVNSFESDIDWLPRTEAELSERWVQPIPSAIFRDTGGRYCVFRQARQHRNDLSRRLTFIVGGHIDRASQNRPTCEVFEETVKREVTEEVGVTLDCQLKPVGMVVDASSIMASRHIGLIYEVAADGKLNSMAGDEFSIRSKYNGVFLDMESLARRRAKFDPWSAILFTQYLSGRFSMDLGRQPGLAMSLE